MSTVLERADEAEPAMDRAGFNIAVWEKLLANPDLAANPYRIETDEHGQIIMSPPPAPSHGNKQSKIACLIGNLTDTGEIITECPISTSGGVKAADVAWCCNEIWNDAVDLPCFITCPEICVEVLSPSNTRSEIEEKKRLYFEAGAREVWTCSKEGKMSFFRCDSADVADVGSQLIPDFPLMIG
ncbi:MAG: Uma2 family endonuclease [Verrucomicrobiales bacterium]|jgi:Uma2 family endonuclease